jgi:hypothetical protein
MYIVQKDERYYALDQNNTFFTFKNYKELLDWLYKFDQRGVWGVRNISWLVDSRKECLKEIGHNLNDTYTHTDYGASFCMSVRKKVDYVIFDADFRVVDKKILLEALDKHEYRPYYRYYRGPFSWGGYKPRFRKDPIPLTGKYKWKFAHYYKTRCTCIPERRHLDVMKLEGLPVRGKRTRRYLPDPWDDKVRADSNIKRSWKKVKKRKQWM